MEHRPPLNLDSIPDTELVEWLASLEYVIQHQGRRRAELLLSFLNERAFLRGVEICMLGNTPHVNTIAAEDEPPFPGDLEIETRLTNLARWNAMAMVVQANRRSHGIGGHISTYASAATLWEVGFNHFWRAATDDAPGDLVFFQGHGSPGVYARAFLEGRLTEARLHNFRRELTDDGGLSSYPHPWLMPEFWEMPSVSMGLAPITAIYQARFWKYLVDRGLAEKRDRPPKVWAMVGDGEMDEPESVGAIHFAGNQQLDNLIFVVNCNLQRLDGPVRGNGSIVRELERFFRGAGWAVLKVLWSEDWDPLLASPAGEKLIRRMGETCDGDWQKYVVAGGGYMREHFFGADPDLAELVEDMPDEKLAGLRRGGHDPKKVYAAYQAASETVGRPVVILAQTVKGYGQGEAGEGRNISHKQKDLNERELMQFRTRLNIPLGDDEVAEAPFYRPADDSPEVRYLLERRERLGGCLPRRREWAEPLDTPDLDDFADLLKGSPKPVSTTMAFVRLLSRLLRDERVGKYLVPIVPDEARTFGMESLFRQCGIYSHVGQRYTPVDSDKMLYYRESTDGQILEEGITEAGCAASFIAAGSSHATRGIPTIPVFLYYSIFGFQRRAQPRHRRRLPLRPPLRPRPGLRGRRPDPRRHETNVPGGRERDRLLHHRQREPPHARHARRRRRGHLQGPVPAAGPGRRPREGRPARATPGQRQHALRGPAGAGAAGRDVRRGRGRLERHELDPAGPRRHGRRAMEPPASRRRAPQALHRRSARRRGGALRGGLRLRPGRVRAGPPVARRGPDGAGHGRVRPQRHPRGAAPLLRGRRRAYRPGRPGASGRAGRVRPRRGGPGRRGAGRRPRGPRALDGVKGTPWQRTSSCPTWARAWSRPRWPASW